MSDDDIPRDWRGTEIKVGAPVIYGGPVCQRPMHPDRYCFEEPAPIEEPTAEQDTAEVIASDVRALLDALGLGDHARPYSAHDIVQREILPVLRARLAPRISLQLQRELLEVVDNLSERADEADSGELQEMADTVHALTRAATHGLCLDCGTYERCNCDAMADWQATGGD